MSIKRNPIININEEAEQFFMTYSVYHGHNQNCEFENIEI